jgi:hypothetical protein
VRSAILVSSTGFQKKLWEIPLQWLKFAGLPEDRPGTLVQPGDPRGAYDEH